MVEFANGAARSRRSEPTRRWRSARPQVPGQSGPKPPGWDRPNPRPDGSFGRLRGGGWGPGVEEGSKVGLVGRSGLQEGRPDGGHRGEVVPHPAGWANLLGQDDVLEVAAEGVAQAPPYEDGILATILIVFGVCGGTLFGVADHHDAALPVPTEGVEERLQKALGGRVVAWLDVEASTVALGPKELTERREGVDYEDRRGGPIGDGAEVLLRALAPEGLEDLGDARDAVVLGPEGRFPGLEGIAVELLDDLRDGGEFVERGACVVENMPVDIRRDVAEVVEPALLERREGCRLQQEVEDAEVLTSSKGRGGVGFAGVGLTEKENLRANVRKGRGGRGGHRKEAFKSVLIDRRVPRRGWGVSLIGRPEGKNFLAGIAFLGVTRKGDMGSRGGSRGGDACDCGGSLEGAEPCEDVGQESDEGHSFGAAPGRLDHKAEEEEPPKEGKLGKQGESEVGHLKGS